tara:strand:+ start:260 stop:631 length:372 start_codon:yes stop_codon:yes gene_type:complete
MILKDGTDYEVQTEDILRWQKTYKDIDVYLELDKMESWCIDYPQKRKTRSGVKKFINGWLNRANEKGGSPIEVNRNKTSIKDSSMDADLYDIGWLPKDEQEGMKPYFLEKYGKYFIDGQEYTS